MPQVDSIVSQEEKLTYRVVFYCEEKDIETIKESATKTIHKNFGQDVIVKYECKQLDVKFIFHVKVQGKKPIPNWEPTEHVIASASPVLDNNSDPIKYKICINKSDSESAKKICIRCMKAQYYTYEILSTIRMDVPNTDPPVYILDVTAAISKKDHPHVSFNEPKSKIVFDFFEIV
jgi:hypothetical protein